MDTRDSIFVKCDCGGCNVLEINADSWDDDKLQFNIAVWVAHPGERPLSKKERIRWCDHVMKTGKPWADHTIVTTTDAQRIVKFIQEQIAKYGKKKDRPKASRTRPSAGE